MQAGIRRRARIRQLRLEELERRRLLYAVNDPGDAPLDPAKGPAETASGTITLRSAIEQINLGGGSVTFSGPMTIAVGSELDAITAPDVSIDGGQVGSVVITGKNGFIGLVLDGGGATVKNLVIDDFGGVAIDLASSNNTIKNDYVGTDASGTVAMANGTGVEDTVGHNIIQNNLISGNSSVGITLVGASGDHVTGNLIGTDVTGSRPLGNKSNGVSIYNGASNNAIGGTTSAARNLISGNAQDGIDISGPGTSGNLVQGNLIGTDVTGRQPLGNGGSGLAIFYGASSNTIGGNASAARNLISGNALSGVAISGRGTSANLVAGNDLGLTADATRQLANAQNGIAIFDGASGNTVGGTTAAAGNIIAGNGTASTPQGYYANVAILNTHTSSNLVEGNDIGTNADNATGLDAPFTEGALIGAGAFGNSIGGSVSGTANVISGNTSYGVVLDGAGTSKNWVAGNDIGTNKGGTSALANAEGGVNIFNGASENTIGGSTAAAANVISGNHGSGIFLTGAGTSGNAIEGNHIGTDITGTLAIGNAYQGVVIGGGASRTTIGGNAAGDGNIISGNSSDGVDIASGAMSNLVDGNRIGVNGRGTAAITNGGSGIVISNATRNTVGGLTVGKRNVIAGNRLSGVRITGAQATGNLVEGNLIGTKITATLSLGNALDGVRIDSGATGNTIGGTSAGAGNVISFNAASGVRVGLNALDAALHNAILENSIFSNSVLGIDIDNRAPQRAPALSAATIKGSWTKITGTVSGNAHTTLRLEFFANPTGTSQGKAYLGAIDVRTNAKGTASFTFSSSKLAAGWNATATATDQRGNTSEFSAAVVVRKAHG